MLDWVVVLGVAGAWVSIGIALALVMGRRGYDAFAWAILGAVFGPLAVVLAVDAVRHSNSAKPPSALPHRRRA